jgi:putative Mn2+ efflux pump MntP
MRNRIIRPLLIPIAILLWIIGWTMVLIGFRKEQETQRAQTGTTQKEDLITIIPMIPEELEA